MALQSKFQSNLNAIGDEIYDHLLDRFDFVIGNIADELIQAQGLDLDKMSEEESTEEWMKAYDAAVSLILHNITDRLD